MDSTAVPGASAFEQMRDYHDTNRGLMEPEKVVAEVEAGPGLTTKTKSRQMPRFLVLHCKYNAAGEIVDYHEDRWRCDYNTLYGRLNRRYGPNVAGAGQPVWIRPEQLPSSARRPVGVIPCTYPGCPIKTPTPEELRVHMQAYHKEYFAMEEQRQQREAREEEVKLLREQNETMRNLLGALMGGRGVPRGVREPGKE